MSSSTNNRWRGQGYGAHGPNDNDWNVVHPVFSRPPVRVAPVSDMFYMPPVRVAPNASGGFLEPWSIQEGMMARPFSLASFRVPLGSPMPFLVLDHEIARDMNPRPRQSIPESPPRFMGQWTNVQAPTTQEEDSRLTQDEQNKALKKLKKEIYNPASKMVTPKLITQRMSLYYRGNAANARSSFNEKGKEEDEDGKRCAICLDDFEPQQLVMLTPCSHMFHEECIVPWVKSHGQCPVCRFAICERMGEHARPLVQNNYIAGVPASDDIVSFMRAVNEAFEW